MLGLGATLVFITATASPSGSTTLSRVWHYQATASGVFSQFTAVGAVPLDVAATPSVTVEDPLGSAAPEARQASDSLLSLAVPAASPQITASTLEVNVSGTTGTGSNGAAHADATVQNLAIAPAGLGATVVKSTCDATKTGTVGSTTILGGTGALSAVAVNPAPNTKIPLGLVTIVLNEQTVLAPDLATALTPTSEHALRVRAIHVIGLAPNSGDIVVSESICSVRGPR